MTGISLTATLKNGLGAYIKKIDDAPDEAAEELASIVRTEWARRVHVVTGSYRESLAVVTHTGSDFSSAASRAKAANPAAKIVADPGLAQRKGAARVVAAVQHAVPAAEAARNKVRSVWAKKAQP
jgi:hypothetical protein